MGREIDSLPTGTKGDLRMRKLVLLVALATLAPLALAACGGGDDETTPVETTPTTTQGSPHA